MQGMPVMLPVMKFISLVERCKVMTLKTRLLAVVNAHNVVNSNVVLHNVI